MENRFRYGKRLYQIWVEMGEDAELKTDRRMQTTVGEVSRYARNGKITSSLLNGLCTMATRMT